MSEFDAGRNVDELTPEEAKAIFYFNEDLKEVWNMNSGAGKRIILDIFKRCQPLDTQFFNSGSATNYHLGRASIGQELANDIIMAGIPLSAAECSGVTSKDISNKLNQINADIIKESE